MATPKKAPKTDAGATPKKAPSFGWALNPHKLDAAKKHVQTVNAAAPLSGKELEDAVKERYIELKGPLPGEERHKNGRDGKGIPTPTSKAAIEHDAGEDETDEDDEEDEDSTAEGDE